MLFFSSQVNRLSFISREVNMVFNTFGYNPRLLGSANFGALPYCAYCLPQR